MSRSQDAIVRIVTVILLMAGLSVSAAPKAQTEDSDSDLVTVAMVNHAGGKSARCFSTNFLTLLEYESTIRANTDTVAVDLDSPELFRYPLAILTGEGEFELNEVERANLRRYLRAGGTMLVSSGCSNLLWAQSMERELNKMFPDAEMVALKPEHEIFHIVFEVASLVTTQGGQGELRALEIDGRAALLYSPDGLNDTDDAAGGCCCCGGSEIRQAKFINANILAYALTR